MRSSKLAPLIVISWWFLLLRTPKVSVSADLYLGAVSASWDSLHMDGLFDRFASVWAVLNFPVRGKLTVVSP